VHESVLYFPHIEIETPQWLKISLLLWDKVYRIVPKNYVPLDTADTKRAVDADLVRAVNLEPPDLQGISRAFERFLNDLPFIPAGLESGETSLLHPGKIDVNLYPLLEQYAQGGTKGGWIELPREIVRGYMFFLSTQVAKRRQLERCTDDKYSFAVSSYFSEEANFGERLYNPESPGFYSSLIFEDLLPSNVEHIPMDQIIRVAQNSRDERTAFREQLLKFTTALHKCESSDHASTIANDYKRDLIAARDRLKASQGFLGEHDRGSLLTMGIPVALTAYGGLIAGGANPFGIHTLSSSLLIGAIAAYADFRKAVSAAKNPYGAA
jgi:hypothetical protein